MASLIASATRQVLNESTDSRSTPPVNSAGGKFIAVLSSYRSDAAAPTITDTYGNAYTACTPSAGPLAGALIFYCVNPIVGAAHSATIDGASTYRALTMLVFDTVMAAPTLDQQSGANGNGVNVLSPGAVTPTQDNEIIVAVLALRADGPAAISGGFTIAANHTNSPAALAHCAAYLIQGAAASVNPQFSWTDPYWCAAAMATFKPAAAAGPTITTQPSASSVTAPATASFTAAATSSGGTLLRQWQRSTDNGSTWANAPDGTGATTDAFTTTATAVGSGNWRNGYQVRCRYTDDNGTAYTNAVTLTVAAPAPTATLNFQAAGMEFGRRTGLGISTFAIDAGVSYRYTVHADALTLGAPILTSAAINLDSAGKLPNLVSSSITAGVTYWVVAVNQVTGQRGVFSMVAA